jgi:hypothetical protein
VRKLEVDGTTSTEVACLLLIQQSSQFGKYPPGSVGREGELLDYLSKLK